MNRSFSTLADLVDFYSTNAKELRNQYDADKENPPKDLSEDSEMNIEHLLHHKDLHAAEQAQP